MYVFVVLVPPSDKLSPTFCSGNHPSIFQLIINVSECVCSEYELAPMALYEVGLAELEPGISNVGNIRYTVP